MYRYVISSTGMFLQHCDPHNVYDIRYFAGLYYCITSENDSRTLSVRVYSSCDSTKYCFESPCSCSDPLRHSLHIGSNGITLSCPKTNNIYSMTHTGELLHRKLDIISCENDEPLSFTGSEAKYLKSIKASYSNKPNRQEKLWNRKASSLCHNGGDAMLMCDKENNRLNLANGEYLTSLLLNPYPEAPLDAVFVGGTLYVLQSNNKIIKYCFVSTYR